MPCESWAWRLLRHRKALDTSAASCYKRATERSAVCSSPLIWRESTMPARTGQDYIKGLQEQPREVWICGERVADVTTHPALRNGVRSIAALYDMQHDPDLKEEMTYISPTTGESVGLSFIIPRSQQDVERRTKMMLHWARATCGMMGRSPDFLNVNFAAWAAAADYFGQNRPEFKTHIVRYYEHIREHDLTLTHALINLQRQRTPSGVQH